VAQEWEDETVRVWDCTTGQEIRCFRGQDDTISALAFSADSRRLISGGRSGSALVWDLVDHSPAQAQPRFPASLNALWDRLSPVVLGIGCDLPATRVFT
jgi:WD40 repeat protein